MTAVALFGAAVVALVLAVGWFGERRGSAAPAASWASSVTWLGLQT